MIFVIRINFNNVDTILDIKKQEKLGFKFVSEDVKKQEAEFRHKFVGRESWYEIEGSDEKIERFSGSGPQPPYPLPEGDIVDIVFNID